MKNRLDKELQSRGYAHSRSQAENMIKLSQVLVNNKVVTKAGTLVSEGDVVSLNTTEQYVSRAGLKLASVADVLELDFHGKTMLDVGSSTGGFTDYALQHGATKVFAVDVGTDQLHRSLHGDQRIELHEKTDIRDFRPNEPVDIVVLDVSFVSLRQILPHIASITTPQTQIVAMVKPQFEAGESRLKHKGVIKNDAMRRQILQDFEVWAKKLFVIQAKADSHVAGAKGNRERFYLLHKSTA